LWIELRSERSSLKEDEQVEVQEGGQEMLMPYGSVGIEELIGSDVSL
jgi:hypothetical protein